MQRLFLSMLCLALSLKAVQAQEIQNSYSYRNAGHSRYLRVNYENDLAFGTDYYFTQGAHLEYVFQAGNSRMENALFPLFRKHRRHTGLGLESAGYTPTSIFADSILHGDRPFAGMAYLKAFSIGQNSARKERYASTLTMGWMGPAAGGYEIQSAIHRKTGNADPSGWKHQIGNALIVNYEQDYERALFTRKYLLLSVTGMLRAGTYSIKAAVGGILMAGLFDDPYGGARMPNKLRAYLYLHPQLDFVGYDATLQGGLFTDNSPYTISPGEIARSVFRCDGGWRIGYDAIWLSMYVRYLSREFESGLHHSTGGLELTVAL